MPQLRKRRPGSSTPPPAEIKLRRVVPSLPLPNKPEYNELLGDLTAMGCRQLALKPWGFKDERMIREIMGGASNEFDNSLRGRPDQWTEDVWRAVYEFKKEGGGYANRKDEYINGKFEGPPNPKDGYAVDDCIDDRERRLLRFLVPVLHPEKPTRVTITLGNTIFGALTGDRKVH